MTGGLVLAALQTTACTAVDPQCACSRAAVRQIDLTRLGTSHQIRGLSDLKPLRPSISYPVNDSTMLQPPVSTGIRVADATSWMSNVCWYSWLAGRRCCGEISGRKMLERQASRAERIAPQSSRQKRQGAAEAARANVNDDTAIAAAAGTNASNADSAAGKKDC